MGIFVFNAVTGFSIVFTFLFLVLVFINDKLYKLDFKIYKLVDFKSHEFL